MYRTSPVLKTKTRQIGTNKNNRNTLGPYTQTLKVECVSMHVGMGGMPIDGGGGKQARPVLHDVSNLPSKTYVFLQET